MSCNVATHLFYGCFMLAVTGKFFATGSTGVTEGRLRFSSSRISLVGCGSGAKLRPAGARRRLAPGSFGKPTLQVEICCSRHPGQAREQTRSTLSINLEELHAPPSSRRRA